MSTAEILHSHQEESLLRTGTVAWIQVRRRQSIRRCRLLNRKSSFGVFGFFFEALRRKANYPLRGTTFGKRSRGRQAADSIEPRMGFQWFSGGLCRGAEDSFRLFAAVQRIRGVQDPGRVPLGGTGRQQQINRSLNG